MTENQYLLNIINEYIASQNSDSIIRTQLYSLLNEIQLWANGYLLDIITSGSRAKGTAIKGSSDIDFLISLSSSTPNTLAEIYNLLYDWLVSKNFQVRKQNVSLGITYKGYNVDLVPAKKYQGNTNYHSLYCRRRNSWMQTNIQQHINYVINSGRINEIKIIKIWAKLHNLVFPSIYLEHIVIEALKNKNKGNNFLGRNVMFVFQYIIDNLLKARIIDISNTNNIISDDLTQNEKLAIVNKAKDSKQQAYWEKIVW
ncbi:nucleotidyltransferase [bacterium]|nr:nucleotidyltransferase [bacterium]